MPRRVGAKPRYSFSCIDPVGAEWGVPGKAPAQIVRPPTHLPEDAPLYPRVCLHERYAMCARFGPAAETSLLMVRHQFSRWISSAAITAIVSPFLSRPSAQAADGIYFPDIRPPVCCVVLA